MNSHKIDNIFQEKLDTISISQDSVEIYLNRIISTNNYLVQTKNRLYEYEKKYDENGNTKWANVGEDKEKIRKIEYEYNKAIQLSKELRVEIETQNKEIEEKNKYLDSLTNKIKEAIKNNIELPPPFPWFPPPPSAKITMSDEGEYFKNCNTFGDVCNKLNKALNENNYERAYFYVPNGFAIVTKLEVINEDGSSRTEPDRWDVSITSLRKTISLGDYIRALFWGKIGYYRTIVFIVTDQPIKYSKKLISDIEMNELIKEGQDWLDDDYKLLPFTKKHKVNALIYEFQIKEDEATPSFCDPSRLTAKAHLEMSNIINKLK